MAANARSPQYVKTSLAVSLGLALTVAACETPEPVGIEDNPSPEVGLTEGGAFEVRGTAIPHLVELTDQAVQDLDFGISTNPLELMGFIERALQTGEVDLRVPRAKELLHEVLENVKHSASFGEVQPFGLNTGDRESTVRDGHLIELLKMEEEALAIRETPRDQAEEGQEHR